MMIWLTPIVSRLKTKWYKLQTNKKLTLNSQLQTYQILTNNDQMLILGLSYFITSVPGSYDYFLHAVVGHRHNFHFYAWTGYDGGLPLRSFDLTPWRDQRLCVLRRQIRLVMKMDCWCCIPTWQIGDLCRIEAAGAYLEKENHRVVYNSQTY